MEFHFQSLKIVPLSGNLALYLFYLFNFLDNDQGKKIGY